jgi:hypothetical protein
MRIRLKADRRDYHGATALDVVERMRERSFSTAADVPAYLEWAVTQAQLFEGVTLDVPLGSAKGRPVLKLRTEKFIKELVRTGLAEVIEP